MAAVAIPLQPQRPKRPPMSARTLSATSVTSHHSHRSAASVASSFRSVATSAFSGILDPDFANLFRRPTHTRNRSSVAANGPINTDTLPDFAFLSYPTLPASAAQIGVRDEASWSYSGPLLRMGEGDQDGKLLPESFYEFARSALKCALPPHLQPARGYYSDTEEEGGDVSANNRHHNHNDLAAPDPAEVLAASLVPFLLYANSVLAANGVNHYWVTVRSTRPSHEFDTPRWHTDDFFWDTFRNIRRPTGPCRGECDTLNPSNTKTKDLATDWKLCTTLLGPPTLFLPMEYQAAARSLQRKARAAASRNHECATIRCVGCTTAAQAVRDVMNRETDWMGVLQHAPANPPNPHGLFDNDGDGDDESHHSRRNNIRESRVDGMAQCAFFRIGEDRGAVHSEPPIGEDRIFVNVVPAREHELSQLMRRWGMQYPRDWWVGTEAIRRFPTSGSGEH